MSLVPLIIAGVGQFQPVVVQASLKANECGALKLAWDVSVWAMISKPLGSKLLPAYQKDVCFAERERERERVTWHCTTAQLEVFQQPMQFFHPAVQSSKTFISPIAFLFNGNVCFRNSVGWDRKGVHYESNACGTEPLCVCRSVQQQHSATMLFHHHRAGRQCKRRILAVVVIFFWYPPLPSLIDLLLLPVLNQLL